MAQGRKRGLATISALFFILIMSILLIGVGFFATAHQQRATMDQQYASALNIAEAGVNYEFNKISADPTLADQSPGGTYSFGNGTVTVYCMNKDGTTPWSPSQYLYVVSQGTVNGVSRSVKVATKGYQPDGKYAIYTMDSISVWKGASATINGDAGTNGQFQYSSSPTINGSIFFNGPNAGWSGTPPTGYTVTYNPRAIQWPSVDQIANQYFLGNINAAYGSGLAYVATHNNNMNANPPIVGNSITSAVTLTSGDYYVENLSLSGSNLITFDNRNGPVNLWIGPDGGTAIARFRGGSSYVSIAQNPAYANHIYVATQGGIDLGGNTTMDALVYAYNKDSSGNEYGYATNSGNPIINGQIFANKYDLNGNIILNYIVDLIHPMSYGYYGYDNSWLETTPGM